MKTVAKFEQALGGDGGKVVGEFGVEQDTLKVQVSATFPIEKIIEPAVKVIDGLVDKLEALIPGDQTAMAAAAKADAKAALIKMLSEESAA